MKFRTFGRIALALTASLGLGFGVTSCATDHTVGYLWVTSSRYNQISGYRIDANLGNLTATPNSPYSSGGENPIKAVVAGGGKFVYVLNAGCGGTSQVACPSGTAASETGANISLFSVGGAGALTFQQIYYSEGNYPISLMADSSGAHLFVLDSQVPDPTVCTGYVSTNPASVCGDISVFSIDPNTGYLSLITNEQVKDTAGTNLTYFPIGSGPINFALYSAGEYIYTIETGSGSTADPSQAAFVYLFNTSTGQLTLTQNTPIPTSAIDLTYLYASSKYVYLIDAGATSAAPVGQILPYTVGTNGALQSVVGGAVINTGTVSNPGPTIIDHTNNFLYVANLGPNLTPSSAASSVNGYFVNSVGVLSSITAGAQINVAFGAGSSPRCVLEDPSNQYLYTANYDDSTISGAVIDQSTGTLTPLRKNSTFNTAMQPTWCITSGTLFP